eukprot:3263777-Amphidinium_carterae.1
MGWGWTHALHGGPARSCIRGNQKGAVLTGISQNCERDPVASDPGVPSLVLEHHSCRTRSNGPVFRSESMDAPLGCTFANKARTAFNQNSKNSTIKGREHFHVYNVCHGSFAAMSTCRKV